MIIIDAAGGIIDEPVPTAQQLRMTYLVSLIGADGVEWDLNNGPVTLMAGVNGLFDPPPNDPWLPETIGVPGSRYTGEQVGAHDMGLPVRTLGATALEWRDVDTAFFKSLRTNAYSTLKITSPWGGSVSKPVLRVSLGDQSDDTDPLLRKRRLYQNLTIVAPQPYWQMPDVIEPFTFSTGRPFFYGMLRYLTSAADARTATMTNPGDVPVFTRAVITGPALQWSAGVGDDVTASSTPLADGEHIYIDGRTRSITDDNGVRAYKLMDEIGFPTLLPGVDVPVVASMVGYTSESGITIAATPLRERPL